MHLFPLLRRVVDPGTSFAERDRWFESIFLQRGVYCEPVRAGGCRLITAGGEDAEGSVAEPRIERARGARFRVGLGSRALAHPAVAQDAISRRQRPCPNNTTMPLTRSWCLPRPARLPGLSSSASVSERRCYRTEGSNPAPSSGESTLGRAP